jgi:hypothetical protein
MVLSNQSISSKIQAYFTKIQSDSGVRIQESFHFDLELPPLAGTIKPEAKRVYLFRRDSKPKRAVAHSSREHILCKHSFRNHCANELTNFIKKSKKFTNVFSSYSTYIKNFKIKIIWIKVQKKTKNSTDPIL